jgi:DNA gyrase subunit B
MPNEPQAGAYTGAKIQVLKGLEAVRHRPAMYIGDTDKKGLHHLIWEILDNSVDEAMAGYAKNIIITIDKDCETISVEDDGRGIPVDMHPTEHKSSLEVAMTVLHAGGKMTSDSSGYVASGGLHGVGASCVNALSDKMKVEVCREGHLWVQEYSRGEPLAKVHKEKKLEKGDKQTGTKTTWHADIQIFKHGVKLDESEIVRRLRETAFLNRGLRIAFENLATGTKQEFKYDGGIGDYVLYLIQNKNGIYPNAPIYGQKTVDGMQVEVALSWTDEDDNLIFSYANNIHTIDGGTHLSGFKTSLTRTINKLGFASGDLKEKDEGLEGRDIQEGLTAIVSIRLPQPQFVGQTKAKLGTVEAEAVVSSVAADVITDFFERNPKELSKVVARGMLAQRARKAAKDAAAALKKKSFLGSSGRIPGKLRDCRSGDITVNELFIVEGDSAAGSATGGRDSEVQAILSNKGKIINAEKSSVNDLFKNDEIINLMLCIGTGVKDTFDMDKLKYGKVIIMSDADDDGYHIRTLLLTFFYRFMRPLVEHGHVYVAQAPLYMIERKNDPIYCWSDEELQEQLATVGNKYDIKRFKGLGEMDAEQLAETTMRKGKRRLLQVTMDDAAEAERILTVLMGKNVALRRQHITMNVNNNLVDVEA